MEPRVVRLTKSADISTRGLPRSTQGRFEDLFGQIYSSAVSSPGCSYIPDSEKPRRINSGFGVRADAQLRRALFVERPRLLKNTRPAEMTAVFESALLPRP